MLSHKNISGTIGMRYENSNREKVNGFLNNNFENKSTIETGVSKKFAARLPVNSKMQIGICLFTVS